ncbi:MAG: single-stranded DNA-binding protein [Polyangiaceae bacterium]|nr:single-stranded DNA-binding protein [Polyangiaceae bacterium]
MSEPTLVTVSERLSNDLSDLAARSSAAFVYDPLSYAFEPHRLYLERYGHAPKDVLLLGMNPGPFGMAQTGVPFGDVAMVRDFLGIEAPVGKPPHEHPKRKIEGFACARSEVSGTRLWGWARDRFERPEAFFERFFVANYCPLVFMEESGKNLTPDKLPKRERTELFARCDQAVREIAAILKPRIVVGVGAFAEARAREALAGVDVAIGCVLHPSPASPRANRGWAAEAEKGLRALGAL